MMMRILELGQVKAVGFFVLTVSIWACHHFLQISPFDHTKQEEVPLQSRSRQHQRNANKFSNVFSKKCFLHSQIQSNCLGF
eukprot:Awhi_evm2s3494